MNEYRKLELPRKTGHKKEEYKYFVGTTLKNPLEYEIGEKIVFKIRPKFMDNYIDVPYISFLLISDDGKKEEGYIKSSDDGWFYVETSLSVSGFVYLKAVACDEHKNPIEDIEVFNGSAGADIKNICRCAEPPGDYSDFWQGLKEKVNKTEPELLYCKKLEDASLPDYEIYDMRIKAPDNEYASVIVTYPKGALKGSLKFAMLFQGYGVNSAVPNAVEGYFVVSVNAHCMPNCEAEEFYASLRDNALKGYGFDKEENKRPETTYWAKMLSRNMQAFRYFENHELINKKDYIFVGSSQGGMQAVNMAAHFDKATGVVLNVPWMSDTHADSLLRRIPNSMPKGNGIFYFDISISAGLIKCPVYIIAGLGDGTCNSSTEMALFNAIKSKKYIEFYQNKTHSFTIPWDNNVYTLGETSMADEFGEFTAVYYDWN